MKRFLIVLGALGVCLVIWLKQPAGETVITGRAMGCEWKFLTDERVERESLRAEIATVLDHWEQVLSTWRRASDISRFNRGEAGSAELIEVVKLAERLQRDTGGAFDHRMLGKLTAAGFGPGGEGIDLSSVGKGYAVDRVCEMLRKRGIHRHIFSLAGEVRAGGGIWPVEIESPGNGIAETVNLSDQAMATSGNYHLWNRKEGAKLAGHILDPATGQPVMRPPCGVTVIGPDAALASGWATALFVLGPEADHLAKARGMTVIWKGNPD